MVKYHFYFLFLLTIIGCHLDHPLSVVIDSDQITKNPISDYKGRVSKIQLIDHHAWPGSEIAVIGSSRSDTIWFLSIGDYRKLASHDFSDKKLGLTDGFDLNTELLDVNRDGIFEIMQGGGGFGKVRLLDFGGNSLWTFQRDPELPPNRMIAGDLNNDSKYEFYVADYDGLYQLNENGNITWKVNNSQSQGTLVADVEIFTDRKNNENYLITINDAFDQKGVFQVYDYKGKKVRQFHMPFPIMDFEIVEWNETQFILVGYLEKKAVLMDFTGHIVYQFELENFPVYYSPQGIAVKFLPNEKEYFVLLAHSSSSVGRTQLNIISPSGEIVYQEITNQTYGLISVNVAEKNKEVLIIGGGESGEILEYEMTTN